MSQSGYYHCSVKPVGRAAGRSAVAAAAYRAGERLEDHRTGLTHDYRARAGVVDSFIIVPTEAPAWAVDRGQLWNGVEKATTARNGRLATELELALPHELSAEQRRGLVSAFARDIADRYKVAVDVAIHMPGKGGDHRNHHAHVMISHRELGAGGFENICNPRTVERKVKGKIKAVEISGFTASEDVKRLRHQWELAINSAYEKAGLDIRVDHRSHSERGIAAEPTKHLGPSASGIERRGEVSARGDVNRAIIARNQRLEQIEEQRVSIASAIAELAAERQARKDHRELRAAVRSVSAARILEAMTERRATFSRGELVGVLRRVVDDKAEAIILATELLAHPDIIGLRETADAPISRYTTRDVLAAERQVLRDARGLAESGGGGLSDRQRAAAMGAHKHLDKEQREAFSHATKRGSLAIVSGEAGTGKSTTLAAIRDAYEKSGYRVVGMAWMNSVVQDMAAEGFRETSTIAAALGRIERAGELFAQGSGYKTKRNGEAGRRPGLIERDGWNAKTVLVVDEAAMLSSRHLGKVLEHARAAGAKVILAGDDKQLTSIERGGMFSALQAEHGSAELHTVRRVQDTAQRQAFNFMHAGQFGAALDIFDKAGAIKWSATQDEARAALVTQWAADTKASPDKRRFVFAYSNADVAALNAEMRAIRRERGELGADHILQTRDGPTNFAAGDRVQLTGSAYYRGDKAAGLVTGAIGIIRAIEGARVTVELDGKPGQKRRTVSFAVGADEAAGQFDAIRHGYAGTIYKGQGRTLDQSYLYHSDNWRAASAYVALSRHRESARLYVAREVTRGREPWVMQTGGLEALDQVQRDRADTAYQAWAELNPDCAKIFGLSRYVDYVQGKHAERGRSDYDMAQLIRQISRADETRAASQFIAGDMPPQKASSGGGQARLILSGARRYEALRDAARTAARQIVDPLADLMRRATGSRTPAPLGKYDELTKGPADSAGGTQSGLMGDFVKDAAEKEAEAARASAEKERTRPRGLGLDLG